MIYLTNADIDAKDQLDEEVEEDVDFVLHERADSLFVFPPSWGGG